MVDPTPAPAPPPQIPPDTAASPEHTPPPPPSTAPETAPTPVPSTVPPENGAPKSTDPEKFFKGAKAMDRLKGYLKDVPILHARMTKVVEDQEANLAAARKALQNFDDVTAKIIETVERWEAEEKEKEADGGGAGPDA